MPVPKKRLGQSAQRSRRANWKAILPTLSTCAHCGASRLAHTICGACGFYKDKVVYQKLHQHHQH